MTRKDYFHIYLLMTITFPSPRTDYIGDVPAFKYFNNITINEYKLYCRAYRGTTWDLKEETIKYCLFLRE